MKSLFLISSTLATEKIALKFLARLTVILGLKNIVKKDVLI